MTSIENAQNYFALASIDYDASKQEDIFTFVVQDRCKFEITLNLKQGLKDAKTNQKRIEKTLNLLRDEVDEFSFAYIKMRIEQVTTKHFNRITKNDAQVLA